MTLDALRLQVPDILKESEAPLANLAGLLDEARRHPQDSALQQVLCLLFDLNRSHLTLLERQRVLQNFSEEFRFHAATHLNGKPPPLFVKLCDEMACGFKRLLLQILQGHQPSRPHLAWCLYMAQSFLTQSALRNYELYQEPPPALWRDSHLLYWIGDHQKCLDEPVAAAFRPTPANTLRGLYQQTLLLALSNPFHLDEGTCTTLFGALAPLARLARLVTWDADDENGGPTVDLTESQPCLPFDQQPDGARAYLRRLELGALLVALHEHAPLRSDTEQQLLEKVRPNWLGQQQRRHPRIEHTGAGSLAVGLHAIHADLLSKHPVRCTVNLIDGSPGGARLLCNSDQGGQLTVGQLVLLHNQGSPTLALVRWRYHNAEGLHLGLRYLKGLARPVWLRRAPNAQTHPGILQSTPEPGADWHLGLWLPYQQFVEGENLWLQLASVHNQAILALPATNLATSMVARYPLQMD
ncbi:PilZ domain-containing protein [Pseudomonas boanensis]|uniref:PilZ domain-containing protein n=1 Tax=Metapseudomonas boanensis TaxID=2822138 RepID=UPI0035D4D8B0